MRQKHWLGAAFVASLAVPAFAAGNVEVAVDPSNATLRIIGDGFDNDVEVTYNGTEGSYTVAGRNGTSINAIETFVSVTGAKSIDIAMGDGADRIDLTDTRVRGAVRAKLDAGNDTIVLSGLVTSRRGRVAVKCGDGNDSVIVQGNGQLGAAVVVAGQEGNDSFTLRSSEFLARVKLDGGVGDDSMVIDNCAFQDRARLNVATKDGNDSLELLNSDFHNDVIADMGRDEDHCVLDDSDFSQDVEIDGGGGGDDDLSLRDGNEFSRNHAPDFDSFEE
jgi:hypothetical protein